MRFQFVSLQEQFAAVTKHGLGCEKRDGVTGGWRELHNEGLRDL
jgi:hypothetical protein